MEIYILLLIAAICIVLLFVAIKKKKMDIFLNFALRLAAGAVGIYLLNTLLAMASVNTLVAMLYGLGFYFTI